MADGSESIHRRMRCLVSSKSDKLRLVVSLRQTETLSDACAPHSAVINPRRAKKRCSLIPCTIIKCSGRRKLPYFSR